MSIEVVRKHLSRWGRDKDIIEMADSTATVTEAAAALGVEPARIAKTISVRCGDQPAVIVACGDKRLDNKKFKQAFGSRVRMLSPDEALAVTGHAVGGVCPFGLPEGVPVFLDLALKRFKTVFPACGSANSAIELSPEELAQYAQSTQWVDVCV